MMGPAEYEHRSPRTDGRLRFSIMLHDWPSSHLDLFLDAGDDLQSWKLPADFSPLRPSAIAPNAPHRLLYLDYEGEVAGGRGTVRSWDGGTYRWELVETGRSRARFEGAKLVGLYEWKGDDTGAWSFGPVT